MNTQIPGIDADVSKYLDTLINLAIGYAPKLILAIVVYIVGSILIRIVTNTLNKVLSKRKVDITLHSFFRSFTRFGLRALLIIIVASMLGVQMTSIIALLGAVGLAIGMALSGTLQNFAGGIVIMVLRPFRVGDFIQSQGILGSVKDIGIFNTQIRTVDNKTVYIPNGPLSNDTITNYTFENTRRLDLVFGIGYEDDIDKAKKVMLDIIAAEERVLKDPAPVVRVAELADSAVNFAFNVWVPASDYLDLKYKFTEEIKKAFDKKDISIPYPQRDIHIYNHDA